MSSNGCVALLVALLLALAAPATLLHAQDQSQDPGKTGGTGEQTEKKAEIPDLEKQLKRLREEAIRNPSLADPEILVGIYKDAFRSWPYPFAVPECP